MATPFGSMPADRDLAAFGVACGALLLGVTAPNLVFLAGGHRGATFPAPWWLALVLGATAVAFAFRVQGWLLRTALAAFAALQVNAIVSLAPRLTTVLEAACAASLLLAAWPHSGRRARIVAIALLVSGLGFRAWVLSKA